MSLGLGRTLSNRRVLAPAGPTLGPELVTNGDFSSAAGWTLGTGWSIAGGVASQSGTTYSDLTRSDLNIPASTLVRVTVVVSAYTSGALAIAIKWFIGGAGAGPSGDPYPINGAGTFTYDFTTVANGASAGLWLESSGVGSGFIGSIDSVSVKKLG